MSVRQETVGGGGIMRFNVTYTILLLGILVYPVSTFSQDSVTRETVTGKGCYSHSDDETRTLAKKKALARAREQTVSGYQVWVESKAEVKNYQLQEELIQTISAGMLHKVKINEEVWNGTQICVEISAEIGPNDIGSEVQRRQEQLKIKEQVTSETFNPDPAFGLRIWLNKADGRFVEGDYLIINVQADRDAYLKLDYFQANGKVVHLVPNLFRGQAFIQKGETYVFGGKDSPERFIISEPFGDEVIKAVASAQPFAAALMPKKSMSESQDYVETLKKGLTVQPGPQGRTRGIQIMSGSSAALSTTSRQVSNFQENTR